MRVGFAGTPGFARAALAAIAEAGHELPLVLTQPDRPAGRGLRLQPSPVKQEALARGLTLVQPRSLRLDGKWPDDAAAARQALAGARIDVLVVAAYGLILPPWTLQVPPRGCLNIHASLLPRWRGAAPIQRAIEAGDTHTGITLMQMEPGLDTGPTIAAEAVVIGPDDSAGSLQERLAALGAAMIVRALPEWAAGRPVVVPQPAAGVTYAAKIEKGEAQIDWQTSAVQIERRIRAFDPAPGAATTVGGHSVKVWRARVVDGRGEEPGTVLEANGSALVVACGDAALSLLVLQRAGARRMEAAEFLRGHRLVPGQRLEGVGAQAGAADDR